MHILYNEENVANKEDVPPPECSVVRSNLHLRYCILLPRWLRLFCNDTILLRLGTSRDSIRVLAATVVSKWREQANCWYNRRNRWCCSRVKLWASSVPFVFGVVKILVDKSVAVNLAMYTLDDDYNLWSCFTRYFSIGLYWESSGECCQLNNNVELFFFFRSICDVMVYVERYSLVY